METDLHPQGLLGKRMKGEAIQDSQPLLLEPALSRGGEAKALGALVLELFSIF